MNSNQSLDPRVELAHFKGQIEQRRTALFGTGGREFNGLLLLEPGLRKRYMECKAQVAAIESAAVKSNRGISNLSDMREHLELVESLASKSDIPRSELRVYSLDLLRSMSLELELKRA